MTMSSKKAEHKPLFEMPMDPGQHRDFIHPEKKQKFAAQDHPMAKNPAYPEFKKTDPAQKETNWEEVVGSAQYRDTMQRLTTFFDRLRGQGAIGRASFNTIAGAMMQAVEQAMELEKPYRRALEKLAISLLLEQPEFASLKEPYEAGEFVIDAKLGVSGDLSNAVISPEDADEMAQADPEMEVQALAAVDDEEVLKRKVINALIAGGAVSKNYAYQLYSDKLAKINPQLPDMYGLAMAGTELGYFAAPDEAVRAAVQLPNAVGGSEELDMESGNVPIIKVRAMIFPMLVQELAKGLLELVSYEGLPKEPGLAKAVIDKADLADEEAWAMIMGRGLWTRFVKAIGMSETDVTLHLYNYLVQQPPAEFNRLMKTIQAGGPEAEALVKQIADQLRQDIEDEQHQSAKAELDAEEPEGGGNDSGEFGYGGDSWRG